MAINPLRICIPFLLYDSQISCIKYRSSWLLDYFNCSVENIHKINVFLVPMKIVDAFICGVTKQVWNKYSNRHLTHHFMVPQGWYHTWWIAFYSCRRSENTCLWYYESLKFACITIVQLQIWLVCSPSNGLIHQRRVWMLVVSQVIIWICKLLQCWSLYICSIMLTSSLFRKQP